MENGKQRKGKTWVKGDDNDKELKTREKSENQRKQEKCDKGVGIKGKHGEAVEKNG